MLSRSTLHYLTLRYVTLRYVTLRYVTLRYVTLRYVTLRYVTLRYVTLRYVTLRYVTLRYVTLRYITLHCGAFLRFFSHAHIFLRHMILILAYDSHFQSCPSVSHLCLRQKLFICGNNWKLLFECSIVTILLRLYYSIIHS